MRPKTILDTNVLVSSIFGGEPKRIVEAWEAGSVTLFVSQEIVDEYLNVLGEFVSRRTLAGWKVAFKKLAIMVNAPKILRTATHPEDDVFLACAAASRARYLVTGDKPLLKISRYRLTKIVTPAKYLVEIS